MRFILLISILQVVTFVLSLDQAQAKPQAETFNGQINFDKFGKLSVDIKEASLMEIVHEIMRQTHIRFKISTKSNPKITCRFSNMPLNKGLKRLFRDFDFVVIHSHGKPEHSRLAIESIIFLSISLLTNPDDQEEKEIIPQNESQAF